MRQELTWCNLANINDLRRNDLEPGQMAGRNGTAYALESIAALATQSQALIVASRRLR